MLPDLVGYADRWSVQPGAAIRFMVHSRDGAPFDCRFVRILCGDPNPDGLGYHAAAVTSAADGRYSGTAQTVQVGSYVSVERVDLGALDRPLEVGLTIWPTTPAKRRQGLIAGEGWALLLDGEGGVALEVGADRIAVGKPLLAREWYRVTARLDPAGTLSVAQAPLRRYALVDDAGTAKAPWSEPHAPGAGPLLIAALPGPAGHFNGKIERPSLRAGERILHEWDFAQDIPSTTIRDVGPLGAHGVLMQMPTRAVTGSSWTGAEHDWRHAPDQYGAIHFHDSDLADCRWAPSVNLTVPADWPSGIYAAKLTGADGRIDLVPFCVRPARPSAPVAVLIPTFTYQVYGSYVRPGFTELLRPRAEAWGALIPQPDAFPAFGLSSYNLHADGSGVVMTTLRRPMLDTRPRQVSRDDRRGSGCGRIACDSYLIHWLEQLGQPYDVITDHDLHAEGMGLLEGYRVVITGQHPEYASTEMMDAFEGFLGAGGRLMYLGGNGFYWKVVPSPAGTDVLELRRAESGIRVWASEPGEYHHAFDGSLGGLWRRVGRPAHRLVGNGFSAQGTYSGYPYRFTDAIDDPRVAFLRAGLAEAAPGAVLGDYGYMGGGAAGFELDRADRALGTPPHALVIARGQVSDPAYGPVNEDRLTEKLPKPLEELISADMTFFETAAGGAVFSVGSMTYLGSLGWNGYANDVARLTTNVLRRFVDARPFPDEPSGADA